MRPRRRGRALGCLLLLLLAPESEQLAPVVAHLERVGLEHDEKWIASVCGDLAGYLEDRLSRTVQSFGRTVPGGWDTIEVGEAGQEDHVLVDLRAG